MFRRVCIGFLALQCGTVFAAEPVITTACVQLAPAVLETMTLSASLDAASMQELAKRDPKLFAPINERDMKSLVDALGAARGKDGEEGRIAAFRARFSLPPMRLAVLMQDVTAMLARADLAESVKRLSSTPGGDKFAIEWGQSVISAFDLCLEQRYEPFGGDLAFQSAETLILNNRPILENLVLGNAIPKTPPGEIPQEVIE